MPQTGHEEPQFGEQARQAVGEGEIYQRLARMTETGAQGVLATVTATKRSVPRQVGTKMIIHQDGSLTGTVGGGAAEAMIIARAAEVLAEGKCQTVAVNLTGQHGICGGAMDVFLEPVLRTYPFYVIGAGHVGQAMARVGGQLGFRFTLVDDRPEFLVAAAEIPGVHVVNAGPAELASVLTVPRRAAVLICSRNHTLDAGYLEAVIRLEIANERQFAFFGSLGSKSKARQLREMIGASEELAPRMAEVRLPVGLEIGAESPAEIALSVVAEALAVLRGVPLVTGPDGGRACPLRGDK